MVVHTALLLLQFTDGWGPTSALLWECRLGGPAVQPPHQCDPAAATPGCAECPGAIGIWGSDAITRRRPGAPPWRSAHAHRYPEIH